MRSILLGIGQTLAVVAGFVGAGLAAAALYPPAGAPAYPAAMAAHRWLVDGFNVIQVGLLAGRERDAWWGPARRAELLERAAGLDALADPETRVEVVFDGERPAPPPDDPDARVRSVFAPSADAWLLERVARAGEGVPCVVVTADRRLAERLRGRGAQVVSPAAFLARCGGETRG